MIWMTCVSYLRTYVHIYIDIFCCLECIRSFFRYEPHGPSTPHWLGYEPCGPRAVFLVNEPHGPSTHQPWKALHAAITLGLNSKTYDFNDLCLVTYVPTFIHMDICCCLVCIGSFFHYEPHGPSTPHWLGYEPSGPRAVFQFSFFFSLVFFSV